MPLDMWFSHDVQRILDSTYETMRSGTQVGYDRDNLSVAEYERGFADALRVMAMAFGVQDPVVNAKNLTGVRSRDKLLPT